MISKTAPSTVQPSSWGWRMSSWLVSEPSPSAVRPSKLAPTRNSSLPDGPNRTLDSVKMSPMMGKSTTVDPLNLPAGMTTATPVCPVAGRGETCTGVP